jgi:hypothetical protein
MLAPLPLESDPLPPRPTDAWNDATVDDEGRRHSKVSRGGITMDATLDQIRTAHADAQSQKRPQ